MPTIGSKSAFEGSRTYAILLRRTGMTQEVHQSGVARVNGTELYYDVAGAGHPLTLVHGMLLDRRSWDDQFGVFARQYTVLRYDMQGWGDSAQEQAEPPFSPRQDLLSLLDYLNIQKTYLLGLSGGGAVALDFTLEHPDTVDALLLAHQQHMLPLEPPAINRLAEVKVPALIVVGDEDMPETLEIAGMLEQGIAGAKKVVIAGTAHHPNMEKPEEFNRVVVDFLKGL